MRKEPHDDTDFLPFQTFEPYIGPCSPLRYQILIMQVILRAMRDG